MKHIYQMKRLWGTAMLAALFALSAAAQDEAMQKKMKVELDTVLKKSQLIGFEGGVMSNVQGAPYRADQITENTQTLGDGTRIRNERKVTIYRDSMGRVRRETPEQISIWDPGAGVGYTLDTKNMTAGKMQISVGGSSGPGKVGFSYQTRTVSGPAITAAGGGVDNIRVLSNVMTVTDDSGPVSIIVTDGKAKKETLAMQIMEGVSAQGERETTTIEAGEIGNDRPIQIVSERWYSPDLQVEVMKRRSDPRSGEEITRLTNISRAEPDPSLFQVPAGYQLVEGQHMPAMIKLQK